MIVRNSNAWAAMNVVIFTAVLFMGYWVAVPIYGQLHGMFHDDSRLEKYTSQDDCTRYGYYWDDGACSQLPARAKNVIAQQRTAWLLAPFIFLLGLFFWLWTKSTNRDVQQF